MVFWNTVFAYPSSWFFISLILFALKFIPDFSTTAYPLTKLTQQDEDFVWDVQQQKAFEELLQCLISAPILSYPKDEGWYIVDTDASNVGLGGVLSQVQDSEKRVIAYAKAKHSLEPKHITAQLNESC